MKEDFSKKVDEDWKKEIAREQSGETREFTSGTSSAEVPPPPDFFQFITSLGVQGLIFLEKEKDLAQAKYLIDTLSILQEKTKGNLTPDEEKALSEILYSLRLKYVALSEKVK